MTKQQLEDYIYLLGEIEDMKKDLAKKQAAIVSDMVTSSAEFPFSPHQVTIKGVPDCSAEREKLRKKVERLKSQKAEVEAFIESLPNSRQRQLVKLRVLDGMSWNDVAANMGYKYSIGAAKMQYKRIVK